MNTADGEEVKAQWRLLQVAYGHFTVVSCMMSSHTGGLRSFQSRVMYDEFSYRRLAIISISCHV
jgi:hypothetical protein